MDLWSFTGPKTTFLNLPAINIFKADAIYTVQIAMDAIYTKSK